jgi:quercetin dioxygenase-like cupin family protein
MLRIDTTAMALMEGNFDGDPSVHSRANFALQGGNGSERAAVVIIELEPGEALGEHTDSPEEILLVLDGEVEFQIGDEISPAVRGTLAVVPPMAPHSIRNIGAATARVAGFFPSPTVVATFAEPVQPLGERVLVFGEAAVVGA